MEIHTITTGVFLTGDTGILLVGVFRFALQHSLALHQEHLTVAVEGDDPLVLPDRLGVHLHILLLVRRDDRLAQDVLVRRVAELQVQRRVVLEPPPERLDALAGALRDQGELAQQSGEEVTLGVEAEKVVLRALPTQLVEHVDGLQEAVLCDLDVRNLGHNVAAVLGAVLHHLVVVSRLLVPVQQLLLQVVEGLGGVAVLHFHCHDLSSLHRQLRPPVKLGLLVQNNKRPLDAALRLLRVELAVRLRRLRQGRNHVRLALRLHVHLAALHPRTRGARPVLHLLVLVRSLLVELARILVLLASSEELLTLLVTLLDELLGTAGHGDGRATRVFVCGCVSAMKYRYCSFY
eukprot:Rhum_TRINITY_DN56_c0_g1::Rhum_TRINITY_DN56_c0_g1_i1::g.167::m.167